MEARQVCGLYWRRWRIEDAFALTKRLLDLASVWTGSMNAVQWQLIATLMFDTILVTICQQVAQALGEPLERISVKMAFAPVPTIVEPYSVARVTSWCRFWPSTLTSSD